MLARVSTFTAPVAEIDIEGVGVYRLPNMWQSQRINRIRGPNRHTAALALGCGMTVRQFNKLPSEKQAEVHRSYLALMSPSNLDRPVSESAEPRAVPPGHMSDEQKIAIGRRLLEAKASLPHGHFGPWVEEQKGLSRSMALQCMALAKVSEEGEKRAA